MRHATGDRCVGGARASTRLSRLAAALASGAPDDYISSRPAIPAEPEEAPPTWRAA